MDKLTKELHNELIKGHQCDLCENLATMIARDKYWYNYFGVKVYSPSRFKYGCIEHPVQSVNLGFRPKD